MIREIRMEIKLIKMLEYSLSLSSFPSRRNAVEREARLDQMFKNVFLFAQDVRHSRCVEVEEKTSFI